LQRNLIRSILFHILEIAVTACLLKEAREKPVSKELMEWGTADRKRGPESRTKQMKV
jgi:hypothetical protein